MITIEGRTNTRGGGLSQSAASAALVLWRSRMFSTADIAELLSIREADVARLVSAPQLAGEVTA